MNSYRITADGGCLSECFPGCDAREALIDFLTRGYPTCCEAREARPTVESEIVSVHDCTGIARSAYVVRGGITVLATEVI